MMVVRTALKHDHADYEVILSSLWRELPKETMMRFTNMTVAQALSSLTIGDLIVMMNEGR